MSTTSSTNTTFSLACPQHVCHTGTSTTFMCAVYIRINGMMCNLSWDELQYELSAACTHLFPFPSISRGCAFSVCSLWMYTSCPPPWSFLCQPFAHRFETWSLLTVLMCTDLMCMQCGGCTAYALHSLKVCKRMKRVGPPCPRGERWTKLKVIGEPHSAEGQMGWWWWLCNPVHVVSVCWLRVDCSTQL